MNRLAAKLSLVGAMCATTTLPCRTTAQEPQQPRAEALRVFLDCQSWRCDFDHLRREITYVNWVRDRADAQVHVLVTTQTTGGGGTEFTLAFIGLRDFAGKEDTLRYVSRAADTDDETRTGISRTLSFGLVRYAALLPVARDLRVVHQAAQQQPAAALPEDDPWNFWVFSTRVSSFLNGEESVRYYSINGSVSANRTTEALKVSLTANGYWSRDEYDLDEDSTVVDASHSLNFTSYIVWSLGDRWSLGAEARASSSTYYNQDLALTLTPAIEYNVYPYGQSTRRLVTFKYAAGVKWFDYEAETIFNKTTEARPIHSLEATVSATQPWGSVSTSLETTQFLDALGQHRLELDGEVDLRIFKGLSFNMWGSVARVKDQIYLAAGGATQEEILLRRRQLGTAYQFYCSIGFRYTFGSIFNNVVNPRFYR